MHKYILRFQLLPSVDFAERMRDLLDFCDKALIDEVMFFVNAEDVNDGHITIAEVQKYLDVIKRAKPILQEKGIKISVNPWRTLGHYDGGTNLRDEQNFRLMVGDDGYQAQTITCPLCENWRKYYAELLTHYAKELEPDVIWLEDDFRMRGHGGAKSIKQGCFCEEHMRLYNKALNANYTREEFVDKLSTDFTVRKAFLDVSRNTLIDTIRYMSENVKGDFTFGYMTSEPAFEEGKSMPKAFSQLAQGRKKPYNRCSLYCFRQNGLQQYGWNLNTLSMLNRALTGDYAHCVSEVENFPHTMYTKSEKFFRFELLASTPMCLVGTTLDIFEFDGNGAINHDRFARALRGVKPYLSALEEYKLSPTNALGVKVLVNEDVAYKQIVKDKRYAGNIHDQSGFIMGYFSLLGISSSYTVDLDIKNQVVAIGGQTLRSLSDEQIRRLFADNFVVLMGESIEYLFERGLQSLIQATAYEKHLERQGGYMMEEINSDEVLMGISKLRATCNYACGNYFNIRYDGQEKTVYTNVLNRYEKVVGAGITQVGNVLILPYESYANAMPYALFSPLREIMLKRALFNNRKASVLFFAQEENVALYAFDKGDEVCLLCVNYVDDDYASLHIQTDKEYKEVQIIDMENATAHPLSYVYENGTYTVLDKLKGQESYLLILKK